MRQHVFGPLPTGAFPGVDQTDVYEFLTRHAPDDAARQPSAAG
jgi:hypothetical protein